MQLLKDRDTCKRTHIFVLYVMQLLKDRNTRKRTQIFV